VKIPVQAELQGVSAQVAATPVEPYQEKRLAAALLEHKPAPAKNHRPEGHRLHRRHRADPRNGVRVVLKPSQFKNDEVLFTAYRAGGQSVLRTTTTSPRNLPPPAPTKAASPASPCPT